MPQNEIKNFLNKFNIAKIIAILTVIVTIGTLLIGGIAHYGVTHMKEQYDSFYQKRFSMIYALDKARVVYTTDIENRLLSILDENSTTKDIISHVASSQKKAQLDWKSFLDLYYHDRNKKDIKESVEVDQLQKEIIVVNKLLEDAMVVLQKEGKHTYIKSVSTGLLKELNKLDVQASGLITYQYHLADIEKEKIAKEYGQTQLFVFLMTGAVLFISLFFTILMTKRFEGLLGNFSAIIEKRNEEYKKMQDTMEDRVNKAVETARGRDQIMYQHARLASMGEMIGNIAHQWRQPLNALTLLIQSFETKSLSGKLDEVFIKKQVDEGMRLAVSMSDTIEDFRNFFSPSKEKESFALKTSIEDTLEMSSFFCNDENIDIHVHGKKDVKVYGYANEFSQVILNFINNARDNFKLKKMHHDKKIEIEIHKEEKAIVIFFRDNGGGIEPSIIDRVFEPYFTTKHKATGTGIGLFMSKQIIEVQMNGEVNAYNIEKEIDGKPYMCAEFKITFPI